MAIIITSIALLICWFWIESSLFVANKYSQDSTHTKKISYKKFIWCLRILAISMYILIIIYMLYSEKINFRQAIEYCLGILK